MGEPSMRAVAAAITACAILAGCGKSLPLAAVEPGAGPAGAPGVRGAVGVSTANTTRLGGASPTIDAAAVAVAVYPGLTAATRPAAVVLVSGGDWPAALAASVLAAAPLHAPLLYSEGTTLPEVSGWALGMMEPTGAAALSPAQAGARSRPQVIRIGDTATPPGYLTRSVAGGSPAALAVAIERLSSVLSGHAPRSVIVTAAEGPPAMTMPAASLSAQTGAPILYVGRSSIPRATRAALGRLGRHISIYVVGPISVVGEGVRRKLERFGAVSRIAAPAPATNAIAVARFADGSFGWGVLEPGHGLVFANAARPLDGPAAAPLSATGDYGPLLLVESAGRLPRALSEYLSDLQPGAPPSGPVHGVYNHGWLIGDESAISAVTQARLNTVLGISSRPAVEPAPASSTTASTTSATGEPPPTEP